MVIKVVNFFLLLLSGRCEMNNDVDIKFFFIIWDLNRFFEENVLFSFNKIFIIVLIIVFVGRFFKIIDRY